MVDILMATYNGERYISEQLESILKQTYTDFRILIRDDGSQDGTIDIINKYREAYPGKIVFIEDAACCGSAVSNFMQLTKYATADYVMYSDQDDVWLPDKIEVTLKAMQDIERDIESEGGNDKPVLVFSSYKPVDENLNSIAIKEGSNQIDAYKLDTSHLLVQNYVTGCLVMCNRALYSMVGDYSEAILMHDWWLALIAASMGRIQHIDYVTTLYRQHSSNVAGAVDVKSFKYRLAKLLSRDTRDMKYVLKRQAELLLARYGSRMDAEAYIKVAQYIRLFDYGKLRRMGNLVKGKYLKSDPVRVLGQLWYI